MKIRTIFYWFLLAAAALAGFSIEATRAEEYSFIARLNPALDEIVPMDAKVEKLADHFGFLEGPVWVRKGGYLLFSDIPANVIYKVESRHRQGIDFFGLQRIYGDGRFVRRDAAQ